jgi:DNA mismatch endonuclease, patch repair protein
MVSWPGNAKSQKTTFGRLTRSELMARVRSKGNKTTEERFAGMLRRERITGWRRHQQVPGNPDFIWRAAKIALFLDGCFWHGHNCRNTLPKTNALMWCDKVKKNKARDRKVTKRLRAEGWTVVRIWECQIRGKGSKYLAFIRSQMA